MAIYFENLRFGYPGSKEPLFSIDKFHVKKGEKVFLKGPSGSGKTSLLSLVGGVLEADAGLIRILDQDMSKLSSSKKDKFRADHMGYIFQMFNLIPYLSVLENVLLPVQFSKRRHDELNKLETSHEEEALRLLQTLGLSVDESFLHKKTAHLSVGQQQRVACARALLASPEIVIADEPTSALDKDTREAFLRFLFAECERKKMTLLYVSHDDSSAHLFDREVQISSLLYASNEGGASV